MCARVEIQSQQLVAVRLLASGYMRCVHGVSTSCFAYSCILVVLPAACHVRIPFMPAVIFVDATPPPSLPSVRPSHTTSPRPAPPRTAPHQSDANPDSWLSLLKGMQTCLKGKKFTQVRCGAVRCGTDPLRCVLPGSGLGQICRSTRLFSVLIGFAAQHNTLYRVSATQIYAGFRDGAGGSLV